MSLALRDALRGLLREQRKKFGGAPVPSGPDAEQLGEMLNWVTDYAGLNDIQPVLLRKDSEGLFALLPTELASGYDRSPTTEHLCVCWYIDEDDSCAAHPTLIMNSSEAATGDGVTLLLAFLKEIGYTNLFFVDELPKEP